MKAHIFTAFVWTAVEKGYTYECHAIAAHTSAEAEEILKGDFLCAPGDASFIYTDDHVESYYRSAMLCYFSKFNHPEKIVSIPEYANWVDQMTKSRDGHPAVFRMI